VQFRITRHAGSGSPTEAIELLWQHLGAGGEEVSFGRVGSELKARWREDAPVSMERDERVQLGRRAVLQILEDVCERSPGLEFGWYAVSPMR
jgi:hypothetical protein